MTNEVFFEILSPKIEELRKLREIGKLIAAGIIGQSLLKEDFFFCAATDRCMHLIDGFSSMLQERNLTCAGALLRLQLDNCMRTYAAFIAADKDAVIDCVISGNRIDKQKSKDGNLLKDVYLKNEWAIFLIREVSVPTSASCCREMICAISASTICDIAVRPYFLQTMYR